MNLKQFWSILRGRRTNYSWLNASWTYDPNSVPLTLQLDIVDELRNEAVYDPVRQKAADEIERLRGALAALSRS